MNVPLDMFESFLQNKSLKPRTVQNYIYYFNKFTSPIFNQDSVSRFMSLPENRNTVSRGFLLNFKKFLMVNYRELAFDQSVKLQISEVELPTLTGRKKKRIPRQIPHEQILLIEDKLKSEGCKIQLQLSYFCGLRCGELVKIRINSFNWTAWGEDQTKKGECRVYGKGDKEGIAIVPSKLMIRISKFIHTQDFFSVESPLFGDPRATKHSLGSIQRIWQKNLAQASIDAGVTQFSPGGKMIPRTAVHPHLLRHSYGTYLILKGVDVSKVKELLRHSDIQSTQIYLHISKEHLKEELGDFGED